VVVALDPFDEPAPQAVDREPARDSQRLAAGHIVDDLSVGELGEVHRRRRELRRRGAHLAVGHHQQGVAGVKHPGTPRHRPPAPHCLVGVGRLAQPDSVELQQ